VYELSNIQKEIAYYSRLSINTNNLKMIDLGVKNETPFLDVLLLLPTHHNKDNRCYDDSCNYDCNKPIDEVIVDFSNNGSF